MRIRRSLLSQVAAFLNLAMARNQLSSLRDKYLFDLLSSDKHRELSHIYNSRFDKKSIQITPQEGNMIACLLNLHKAKTIVEIGSFSGYSTAWLASVLPKDGRLISIEVNKENFRRTSANLRSLPNFKQITLINEAFDKHSKNHLKELEIDCFFLDAKKIDYCNYLDLCYPLLRKGGVILADNVFAFGNVFKNGCVDKTTNSIRNFNKMISDKKRFITTIIPTKEGLALVIKR